MPKLNCLLIAFLLLNQSLALAIDDAAADKIMAEQRETCAKNTAMEWNTTLNRCVGKQAAREARNSAQACNDISDLAQREKCHIKTAEKSTGLSADTSKLYQGKTTGSMVMNGVIAAYTIIDMISNMAKDKQGSSCTSKKIMGVTSVAGLASDVYLKMQAKKKVKELEEKYKLDTKSSAHEAQLKALEYLKEEQQTVVKIAGLEKKRNMALMAGYALAAGFAIYEMTPYGQNPTCYQSEETKKGQAEALKGQTNVTAQAAPPGGSSGTAGAVVGGGAAAGAGGGKKNNEKSFIVTLLLSLQMYMNPLHAEGAAPGMDKIQEFLNSPQGVLIVSGIATVYSGTLYKGAAKQEEESKENIKKIDKIIASFKDSYSGYCPSGRDSLTEPQCYCYTSDGKQNSTRTNSQVCKDLWAKDSFKLAGTANNYEINPYNVDFSGCVTVTGQFDENCKCKKLVDASGKNACKKESSIAISTELATAGFASSTGLKDLLQFSANSTNGNPRLDSLDAASLANKAINAKKFGEQMLSKIDTSKFGNPTLIDEKNAEKFAKALIGEKNIADAMKSNGGSAANVSSARSDNPEFGNLLKEAQAKAGIELTGGKGINSAKAEKKKGLNLNFGSDGAPTGQVVQDFGSAEDKAYKYKNNDIVTDNSASIFEIISNRYVQSGLRRLFDDEEQKN